MTDLLQAHVERFNGGVGTGDWAPMLDQFDDAAEMEFRGPRGRVELSAAPRVQ